jgi:hypothetical protein
MFLFNPFALQIQSLQNENMTEYENLPLVGGTACPDFTSATKQSVANNNF